MKDSELKRLLNKAKDPLPANIAILNELLDEIESDTLLNMKPVELID